MGDYMFELHVLLGYQKPTFTVSRERQEPALGLLRKNIASSIRMGVGEGGFRLVCVVG